MGDCSNFYCPHGNYKKYARGACKQCMHDSTNKLIVNLGNDPAKEAHRQKLIKDNQHKKRDE